MSSSRQRTTGKRLTHHQQRHRSANRSPFLPHRPHTACRNQTPATRIPAHVTNAMTSYTTLTSRRALSSVMSKPWASSPM